MNAAAAGRVEVVNFGCRLNIAEGEAVRTAALRANAHDIIVFNSCAVTDEAVRQARQAVRRALRERPGTDVVVTGCAAELEAQRFTDMGARVVANEAKGFAESYRLQDKNGASTSSTQTEIGEGLFPEPFALSLSKSRPYPPALSGADHARAFLGVQTGCSHSCTFCATVLARGTARSATVVAVVEAAQTALTRGQREIVLTGVDLASYGDDSGTSLAALVEALLMLPGLDRLRLSSLDPARIDTALFALLTEEARVMPHVHLSLQAGDDMVLTRMKRRHRRADAVALAERLRAARPDIAIGADLIAGFPTEDDRMFANTLALIDDIDIVFGHIFPYSPRAGTPAARMPQVGRAVARERAARLREANARRRHAWMDAQRGHTASMLVERDGLTGHGANFISLTLAAPAGPGSILPVRLTARDGDRMIAQRIAA